MPLAPLVAVIGLATAQAAKIQVRTVACPVGSGPVRVYEKVSSDTYGGFDSDLAAYSAQGQYRQFAVSTCRDNLLSLYGPDMEQLPVNSALSARLAARLDALRPTLPPPAELEVWDRYRIAAEMYRVIGRDSLFLAELLHRASWTARDEAVGIYEGLEGPIAARALLDAGAGELNKDLPAHQRKILLHNLARVAHRGGWNDERDRYLDAFAATGQLTPKEAEVLARFRQIANKVEPALQDEAIAAYRVVLMRPNLDMDDKVRTTYLLADLLRRRGQPDEALPLFTRVMVERTAPLNLKEMAGFLARDLTERHPELAPAGAGG